MRRPRFTIAGILGFVVLLAFGLAALREATDAWDSGVFGATICWLSVAALLAVHRRERNRAFWLGFAMFGGVYLAASLVPSVASRLPTTLGLRYLDSNLSDRTGAATKFNSVFATTGNGYFVQALDGKVDLDGDSIVLWNAATGKPVSVVRGTAENFVRIGHSLLALVAGFLGGRLSRRLYDVNRDHGAAEPHVEAPDAPTSGTGDAAGARSVSRGVH